MAKWHDIALLGIHKSSVPWIILNDPSPACNNSSIYKHIPIEIYFRVFCFRDNVFLRGLLGKAIEAAGLLHIYHDIICITLNRNMGLKSLLYLKDSGPHVPLEARKIMIDFPPGKIHNQSFFRDARTSKFRIAGHQMDSLPSSAYKYKPSNVFKY